MSVHNRNRLNRFRSVGEPDHLERRVDHHQVATYRRALTVPEVVGMKVGAVVGSWRSC